MPEFFVEIFKSLNLRPFALSTILEAFLIWQLLKSYKYFTHFIKNRTKHDKIISSQNFIQLYKSVFFLLLFILNSLAMIDIMFSLGRFQNHWQ